MDYVKRIWLEMGFTEMTGKLVDSSFWNFDVLFTSQDHPVQEECICSRMMYVFKKDVFVQ